MHIQSSRYSASFKSVEQCPVEPVPEFAFIGRSNVGKSSLINMLCNSKGLVKTSNTPGKTQSINFFQINDKFYFVDLPGYGFARISKTERKEWESMIKNYLQQRNQLRCVLLLIDSRHEPQEIDLEFVNFLGEHQIPFVLVFTKSDKLSRGKTLQNVNLFTVKMSEFFEKIPQIFVTSSSANTGREELLNFVKSNLEEKK